MSTSPSGPPNCQLSTARCCPLLEAWFSALGKQGSSEGSSQILEERIQTGLPLSGTYFLELTALLIWKLSCRPKILPKWNSCLEFLCVAKEGISFLFHSNPLQSSSLFPKTHSRAPVCRFCRFVNVPPHTPTILSQILLSCLLWCDLYPGSHSAFTPPYCLRYLQ